MKSILSFFCRVKNLHFPNIISLCDDLSNFQIPLLSIKLNPTEYSIESINHSRKLSKISQDFSKYGRLTTLEWLDLERWSDFRNTWLGRGRNHDTGPCQSRMNDKFGRVQGEEKNQKSRCAGVHGLKGIYTDGRYLSARLPSLYSRLTKCLCTRTDPEWIELRSTRLRLWGASPPPYLPQTSTVSALLNIKRNGTTVPTEISLATTDSVFSHVFSRKVYVSRGSVSMKSTSRSILPSRIYSYAWIFISFSSQSFIWIELIFIPCRALSNVWCLFITVDFGFRRWIQLIIKSLVTRWKSIFKFQRNISRCLKNKRNNGNEIFFMTEIVFCTI